ncbi:MAG TPA: hypothetical protein VGI96_10025 [Streptosporangiaceae bacterium]|jgi:hypothetical protein
MPSKQSEAVRRRWEASRLAMTQPGTEGPDDESWGDLTAEPRAVDYLETEAGGVPAMWVVPKDCRPDRVLLCLHGGGFVAGFENADIGALEKALRTDAAIEMTGTRTWFSGRVTCLRYLAQVTGAPGDWLMTPTRANGQPAVAAYYRDGDGTYQALGVAVLTVTAAGIARITVFGGGAGLVARFGFPRLLEPGQRAAGV